MQEAWTTCWTRTETGRPIPIGRRKPSSTRGRDRAGNMSEAPRVHGSMRGVLAQALVCYPSLSDSASSNECAPSWLSTRTIKALFQEFMEADQGCREPPCQAFLNKSSVDRRLQAKQARLFLRQGTRVPDPLLRLLRYSQISRGLQTSMRATPARSSPGREPSAASRCVASSR